MAKKEIPTAHGVTAVDHSACCGKCRGVVGASGWCFE